MTVDQLVRNGVSVMGTCRLCGAHRALQRSHVVPAFVFRWMRESSATGYLRFGREPNRRMQDGCKKRWFCSPCENQIGSTESQFAKNIFRPVVEDGLERIEYGPWMFRFCVSMTWRVLLLHREIDTFDDYSKDDRELLDQAEKVWRECLLGRETDSSIFPQHLYVVQGVSSARHSVASNVNGYVLRYVDIDVVRSTLQHIVYVKLPRFFIMGMLRDERPEVWRGTEVHAERGLVSGGQRVPDAFFDFVNEKAERAGSRLSKMSDRQQAKVLGDLQANAGRTEGSDTMKAFGLDVILGWSRESRHQD